MKYAVIILFLFIISCEQKDHVPFQQIGKEYETLRKVLADKEKYQVQILYTQIDKDDKNRIQLTNYAFGLDDQKYFYPASTVKLPVAILALEWLNEQRIDGLNAESIMLTDSIRPSQSAVKYDSTAQNFLPSIAHYIKKILLVSDNDAYNRLYELLGQDYINTKLLSKGLNYTIINHRLSIAMSPEENRHFNPIQFHDVAGNVLLNLPARSTETVYQNLENPHLGKAYHSNGELIEESMDFTYKNRFSLSDFHGVIQRIIFPELFNEEQRFYISEADREFIIAYMSMLPRKSKYPKYELPEYYDSYSKFFKFGTSQEPIPANFKIFNKTGQAYGHLLDGSYFVDSKNDVAFFVSAIIYVNENQTLNDNQYEYEAIGFPFFKDLGNYLYDLELKRKK
ncbi:serine hydrolase [Belliella pelovolcani]|uniref:beta-lactamase n=1 Tax=Belliella pelovolcani TaxID=529505 RepID=A0A1N7PB40_9BACT|nr:serine hydrolase [Belliella pelovolcani]SIT07727.1 Beta-lactamase enzyme family protein [Belliella pelovolcani]